MTRLEPATSGTTIRRSNQLSYNRHKYFAKRDGNILRENHVLRQSSLSFAYDWLLEYWVRMSGLKKRAKSHPPMP